MQEFEDVAFVYFWFALDGEVLLEAVHADLEDIDDSLCFCSWNLCPGGDS